MQTETPTAATEQAEELPIDQLVFSRPSLYPLQEAAIFEEMRYSWIEASTKSGKTSGCIVWLTEKAAAGRTGWQYWWVAPIFAQAKIAFRRLKRALSPGCFRSNESECTITLLATQTTICFKGADKPDSLYGEDVHAAVVDEASRCKEDAWFAVRSTLTATGGPIRIIGNVKGRKNWFFKGARKAAAGQPGHAFHRITCHDSVAAGIIPASEILDAKAALPAHIFKQLYEAEAADDEGNPFGIPQIKACLVPVMSNKPPVLWALDLAKTVDWCVATGLDHAGDVCRLERWQGPWGTTKAKVKALFGSLPAIGDSTGVGDAIIEDLQGMGINIEAYVFTPRGKQQLMEGLAADIQQGHGHFPEGVLSEELESFEYEYTANGVRYSAPDGMFDDCVCSYAMARLKYRRGGYGEPFVYSRLRDDADGERAEQKTSDIWRSNKSSSLMD